jgi:malonate transporter and related proteins
LAIILNLAIPFFGLILLGAIAEKRFGIEERGLAWLNIFVFYFAVPPLVFKSIAEAPVDKLLNWPFLGITTLTTYLVFTAMVAVSLLVYRSRMTSAAIQASAASYSNLIYLGLPIAIGVYGQDAAVPVALIACFDNLVQFSLVPIIAGTEDGERSDPVATAMTILRRIGTNPLILAALLGALVNFTGLPIPQPLDTLLTMLARAAPPAALFALGVTVALRPLAGFRGEIPTILLFKIVVHPVLVYLLLQFVTADPMWIGVAILMAALPTAANVFVLATRYRAFVEGASNVILISTVISVFTVSAIMFMIDNQILP